MEKVKDIRSNVRDIILVSLAILNKYFGPAARIQIDEYWYCGMSCML